MKVLLFTHKSDIDGLGAVVLSKLAFNNLTYELCEVYEIDERFSKCDKENKLSVYDKIFITDLCLNDDLILKIHANEQLRNKVLIFDHHPKNKDYNYDWVTIKVKKEKGKCCGTSLFYEYLVNNKYLSSTASLNTFVELTRQYDTWEWKDKYNNELANYLTVLMNIYQSEMYINEMTNKVINNNEFYFTDTELKLIMLEVQKVNLYVEKAIANMCIFPLDGNKVGIVFAESYRNDIAEVLRNQNYDLDYVAIINFYRKTISYRAIKEGFNVKEIAIKNGGGGHIAASSNYIPSHYQEKVIKLLLGDTKQ
ncbi:MAG: hypothetical protein PHY26_02670 [Bacilli bacterium]|jgi:oligoribonuclease NrnB/cAMP/cGMP phosphodiesterase (DHH superfamily)|nr:hypothetical protein [Bacilli bacterium]